MNLLRMVKLFGWERKIQQKISEKREEELIWIRKSRLLRLTNSSLKLTYILFSPSSYTDNFSSLVMPIVTMLATYATL